MARKSCPNTSAAFPKRKCRPCRCCLRRARGPHGPDPGQGSEIIDEARRQGKRIIVLAGRPYHVDPEINHGIDHLITRHGAAVVTEDSISNRVEKFPTSVLNQWTYHSRLYAAAKYCTTQKDMDLVQLVSFGCGVDAITTDETREILAGRQQALHPAQDRRHHQSGCGQHPSAQPVRRSGGARRGGRGKGRPQGRSPIHRRNLWNTIIPNLPRR